MRWSIVECEVVCKQIRGAVFGGFHLGRALSAGVAAEKSTRLLIFCEESSVECKHKECGIEGEANRDAGNPTRTNKEETESEKERGNACTIFSPTTTEKKLS